MRAYDEMLRYSVDRKTNEVAARKSSLPECYSNHFQAANQAQEYEKGEYALGTYSSLLWEIERMQLGSLIEQLRRSKPRIAALDFAAGTGRITAFLEKHVDSVTGIEISQEMCELARKKAQRSTLVCADILGSDSKVEEKFDLITAFRFFLNTEPSLRLTALRALAARLRDRDSLLVFNNHGNLWSHKLLMWPYHAARRIGKNRSVKGNYLTSRQIRRLLPEAGLKLLNVNGCGFYSGKILKLRTYNAALLAERRAAGGALSPFCVNQMYVAGLS
jgi:SAM-dependent methyltransferase